MFLNIRSVLNFHFQACTFPRYHLRSTNIIRPSLNRTDFGMKMNDSMFTILMNIKIFFYSELNRACNRTTTHATRRTCFYFATLRHEWMNSNTSKRLDAAVCVSLPQNTSFINNNTQFVQIIHTNRGRVCACVQRSMAWTPIKSKIITKTKVFWLK